MDLPEPHPVSAWLVQFESGILYLVIAAAEARMEDVAATYKPLYPDSTFTVTRVDAGEYIVSRVLRGGSLDDRAFDQDLNPAG